MTTDPKNGTKPEDKDAAPTSGQADYGSAGGQAAEGVNGAKGENEADAED